MCQAKTSDVSRDTALATCQAPGLFSISSLFCPGEPCRALHILQHFSETVMKDKTRPK